ncbi:MAG: hypothetical protein IJ949_05295, partial [Oscillospiraceae bacterium]|nr:hypothetical protein [Oscillospiraceae bacterium]
MSLFKIGPMRERAGIPRSFFRGKPAEKAKNVFFSPTAIKCLCAFLLSRTSLIGGATPLGFSFFAANFGFSGTYACGIFAVLGFLFTGKPLLISGKYIISMIIFSLVHERFLPSKYQNSKTKSVTSCLSLLASGLFLLFADVTFGGYPLIYDSMVLIVESATVWFCTRAFSGGLDLVASLRYKRTLTAEETVSVAILTGGVLCGLGDFGIPGFFSFTGILCVLCVLLFAVRFGSLQACSAGIIMGIVSCLSRGRIDGGAASYALCGLCSGYFSKNGKWATCISFIITNAVITILSNGSTEVFISLTDTIIATFILYCIPEKVFRSLSRFSLVCPPAFEFASERLKEAQSVVDGCQNSFRRIINLRNSDDNNKMLLYKRTARNTCGSCGLRKYCWGRDAAATKEAMDFLCKELESGKTPLPENAPVHCLRADRFISEFSRMYELYKNDCLWTERLNEFRTTAHSIFEGISKILDIEANELAGNIDCDSVAADNLKILFRKEGISVRDIFIIGKEEEMQISLKLESCGGFGRCEKAIPEILENALGKAFVRTGERSCGECSFTYVVKPAFSITTAVATAVKAKKKVSGDHAIYTLLDRHTYAMVLCDGMGSGEVAREESRTAAKLLVKLLSLKMKPETAIGIINSMLLWSFSGSIAAID